MATESSRIVEICRKTTSRVHTYVVFALRPCPSLKTPHVVLALRTEKSDYSSSEAFFCTKSQNSFPLTGSRTKLIHHLEK